LRSPIQSRAAALAAFTLLAGAAQAQGLDARWGLRWGQTPEEVRTQVKGWSELPPKGDMTLFIVASSHLRHPAFPKQVVGFRAGRLVEVRTVSKLFTEDPEGREGKLAHFGVGLPLQARYGKPSKVYEEMLPPDRQPTDGFYACLQADGCGLWARTWEHAEAYVVLELKPGNLPRSGWLVLRAMEPATH
jgi:hypothetical protein